MAGESPTGPAHGDLLGPEALRLDAFGEHARSSQRGLGHRMPDVEMALRARPTRGVQRMIETRRAGTDIRVTPDAAFRRDRRRHAPWEQDVTGEVRPDLLQRDPLVGEPRHRAGIDMALDAGDFGVRAPRPGVVVGDHLMAGTAEGRTVGVDRDRVESHRHNKDRYGSDGGTAPPARLHRSPPTDGGPLDSSGSYPQDARGKRRRMPTAGLAADMALPPLRSAANLSHTNYSHANL